MSFQIDINEISDFLKTHTNKQTAEHFDVGERTISRYRKNHGLDHISLRYPPDLTNEQRTHVLASMLGDGCIFKNQTRFAIKQTESKKEYLEWLHAKLSPFSIYLKPTHSFLNGKKYNGWQLLTCTHPVFYELRKIWYLDKQKIIPRDLVLTPQILAHWYVQDGSNNQKKKSVQFSTNCFLVEDVFFLIELLKRDLNIKATMNNQDGKSIIYIGAFEYEKTINMMLPHIPWKCFQYKIDMTNIPMKNNPNLGAGKLNWNLANDIREKHNIGVDIKTLSDLYDVTINSIYNVLNYKTYKKAKETYASVNVIYNQ